MSGKGTDVLCELVTVLQEDGVVIITIGLKLAGGEKEFPDIDIGDKCNEINNVENMGMQMFKALCRGLF